jgi:drug/metabolite transporter (DMT)-like permease
MKKVVIYIFISAILFSTMEVTLKIVGLDLDAFQLTFIRFLMGGLFLAPFAALEIRRRKTRITTQDMVYMLILGIICICISMVFFQFGVMGANASTAAVIFCTNPMFTMIFAHFLTDEKMTMRKGIAAGISIAGLILIINPLHLSPGNTLMGMIFSLISAITFGLYSAAGKRRIQKLGGLTQTSISFLLGSAVLWIILIILDKPVFAGINSGNMLVVLYVGIAVTGLGYLYYFLAMEKSNATLASLVFFVKPGIAPIIAVIVLNEVITANVITGILLIFIGSYMTLNKSNLKKV